MSSPNGLLCFTNCLLPQEDGGLIEKDLWIDENRGVILDAQVSFLDLPVGMLSFHSPAHIFHEKREAYSNN